MYYLLRYEGAPTERGGFSTCAEMLPPSEADVMRVMKVAAEGDGLPDLASNGIPWKFFPPGMRARMHYRGGHFCIGDRFCMHWFGRTRDRRSGVIGSAGGPRVTQNMMWADDWRTMGSEPRTQPAPRQPAASASGGLEAC